MTKGEASEGREEAASLACRELAIAASMPVVRIVVRSGRAGPLELSAKALLCCIQRHAPLYKEQAATHLAAEGP